MIYPFHYWRTFELFPAQRWSQILFLRAFLSVSFGAHVHTFPSDLTLRMELLGHCCCLVAKLCLCKPVDYSLAGSSVHGISQARIQEWVAISFSRGSSWPRDQTNVSYIGRWILYHWTTSLRVARSWNMHKVSFNRYCQALFLFESVHSPTSSVWVFSSSVFFPTVFNCYWP